MNVWMMGKNKWNLIALKRRFYKKDITDGDYAHAKRVCKDL